MHNRTWQLQPHSVSWPLEVIPIVMQLFCFPVKLSCILANSRRFVRSCSKLLYSVHLRSDIA